MKYKFIAYYNGWRSNKVLETVYMTKAALKHWMRTVNMAMYGSWIVVNDQNQTVRNEFLEVFK